MVKGFLQLFIQHFALGYGEKKEKKTLMHKRIQYSLLVRILNL